MSHQLLEQLALCVEFGKVNKTAPYPPNMKDQDGADELTKQALDAGIPAQDILTNGLVIGMQKIGVKFRENKVFVPEVLMAAKAMNTTMVHLKPFFSSGEVKRKSVFVVGTVEGDLHDIGKNLVAMMIEGSGYEVIDLGVDVKSDKFLAEVEKHPGCSIGLSALLTTTMRNMEKTIKAVREKHPEVKILVGGAPVNQAFCDSINADFYSPDPQGAVEYLNKLAA